MIFLFAGNDEWDNGYVSGTVYQSDKELSNLMVDVRIC